MKRPYTQAFGRALDAAEHATDDLLMQTINLGARRTTIRIDRLTWAALQAMAQREGITVHELCTAICSEGPRRYNFTIALRVAALRYYSDAATEAGHRRAKHGRKLH